MLNKNEFLDPGKNREEYSMLNYHVLESMADWVRVVDYNGNILYANKAMKESLGTDVLDKKCYQIHGKINPCGFCISKRSIRAKETVQKEEIIDGKYYSIKSSPIFDEEGKAVAAVEVFRDVTRERRLELELIEKNKKMSNDLLFAKRLQQRILPQKGVYKSLSIDHLYRPSEMLSGDMYDIFHIDDEHIGVYICDVVGHGVTASMMTMFVRQTMRAIKSEITSPSEALTELQKRFMVLNLGVEKYFTIFYGVYNIKTFEFRYANAGHNCVPIKYNKGSIELLKSTGFPISLLFDEVYYTEKKVSLEKGDEILLYTDGITEVKNFDGIEFGMDRVIDIVKNNSDKVIESIVDKVERFRWGEQEDDFAMLLIEVLE